MLVHVFQWDVINSFIIHLIYVIKKHAFICSNHLRITVYMYSWVNLWVFLTWLTCLSGSSSKPKPFHDFAIHKKKFNKAPRKKKIRAFEHDPRHPNDQKVHFQDYLQLFSSLRECKPNAPINRLYQPSKFRPPENRNFFLHFKNTLVSLF